MESLGGLSAKWFLARAKACDEWLFVVLESHFVVEPWQAQGTSRSIHPTQTDR